MIVSLSGFMGCGKSTVGRDLLELLPGFELIDLDEFIENGDGRSVAEIFREDGEAAFREMEADAVECLLDVYGTTGRDLILSLGGGTLTNPEVAAEIRNRTENFYLRATVETLVENLQGASEGRPMLDGGKLEDRVKDLMSRRSAVYEATASRIIDTDGRDCSDVAREIADIISQE